MNKRWIGGGQKFAGRLKNLKDKIYAWFSGFKTKVGKDKQ